MFRNSSAKIGILLVVAILVIASATISQARPQVIRLAHVTAEGSHFDFAAHRFAELITEMTNGQVEVQVYPSGQLGDERTVIEALQLGAIEMTIIGHDPLAQFTPITNAISLPYIFKDRAHAYRVLEGPFGEEIRRATLSRGMRIIEFGENGYRVITNSRRPIESPTDMRGLRIRSPQSPVNLAFTREFGGNPIAAPFTEVYTMLQQGVIDGQENALPQIWDSKYYEVQKYLSITNHIMTFTVMMVSENWFQRLSPELQAAVQQAGYQAMLAQRVYSQDLSDNKLVSQLERAGMSVNYPDLEPFREVAKNVHRQFVRDIGQEWYDLIVGLE